MATLFQRLIGDLTDAEQEAGEKIAIHPFVSALYELERGNLTAGQVATLFNLDASQQSDGATLMGFISDAPNKADMIRVFKDWMYIAEWGRGIASVEARYFSQSNLVARLNQEKTRQGV